MIHQPTGVCQSPNLSRTIAALRTVLRNVGLPHDDKALIYLGIGYRSGLTFDQAARALVLMHNTTNATVCPGCRRKLGRKSAHIAVLGDHVLLLCGRCIEKGNADPAKTGATIIRNALAGGAA